MRAGTADLGLLTLPVDDPSLVSVPVMREELLLVTSPQHPLARKSEIAPQDLARQPFVLFEAGSASAAGDRRVLPAGADRAESRHRDRERRDHQGDGARLGWASRIIPYQAVAREVRAGQLFCARIAGQQLVRETGWVHLRVNRIPRPVQEMMRTFDRVRQRLKLAPSTFARATRARDDGRPPL